MCLYVLCVSVCVFESPKEIMVEYKRCHSGMAKEMYIRNMSGNPMQNIIHIHKDKSVLGCECVLVYVCACVCVCMCVCKVEIFMKW